MQGAQNNFDLIVIGNGAIGCAVAFELERRKSGLKIAVVGPNSRQGSASAAAGAMLNVFAELDAGILEKPIFRHKFDLARKATDLWPVWLQDLSCAAPGEGNPAIEFGTFILKNMAGDEQDDAAYKAIKSALVEFHEPHQIINPEDIKGYSPSVGGRALEAIHIPREGAINPRALFETYERAFESSKTVRIVNDTACSVVIGPGDRKTVNLAGGGELSAEKIVLASGADTRNLIANIPEIKDRIVPLFYGIGAALLLNIRVDAPSAVIRTPNRAMACGVHMVPQGKKQVYVGASNQITHMPEFSPRLTSVQFLSESAMDQLNTQYYNAELERVFLGYRPTSADTLPMIGETSVEGLFVLTGTKRDGLHNSPVYAADMADRILGGAGFIDPALLPERKVIRWMTRDDAINLGVIHLRSAGLQHGLRMPRSNWNPMVDDMLRRHVEEVYSKSGVDYGIPPEMLDMYRYGHVTSAH